VFPEAYILVGGRSSRFSGGEKPSARIGGKTLAENAVDIVRTALPGSTVSLLARDDEQFAEESRRLSVGHVHDRFEGRGPLGGLFTALATCESKWLFLFACDMPLMSPDVIADLWRLCEPEFGVVLPRQADGRLQPLCAFYNVVEAIPVVEALIHRPGGSAAMAEAVEALEMRIVEHDEIGAERRVWTNVNTLEELAAAREIERKLSGRGEI
jgi:molybdenum cofactor guanylyltransferase